MHEPSGFKTLLLLELTIQHRASCAATKFRCLLQSGKFSTEIFGMFLPFHFLCATGAEVAACGSLLVLAFNF